MSVNTLITREERTIEDVSKQVQQRLKLVDDLEAMVEKLTAELDAAHQNLGHNATRIAALESIERKAGDLDARERAVAAKENELELRKEINELKIASAEQRVKDHINMTSLVFRNTAVRRRGQVPIAVDGGDMCSPYMDSNGNAVFQRASGMTMPGDVDVTEEEV